MTTPDGTRWRYRYDALGRRVAKERLGADGEVVDELGGLRGGEETGLRAVGVPAAYTRQVAAAYIGHPLLTAIAWAILGAIVAVAVPALFVDNAMLVLTIPWPVVGSVVAASILATTAAAASASRSGQNAAHQPPTWQPRTAHRHRPPGLGVVGRDE